MTIDRHAQQRNAGMLDEQGEVICVAGCRGTSDLERNGASLCRDMARGIACGRLLWLEGVPIVHGSRIVRGDTHSMIGLAGMELLGGTVELPQVKDLRTLFCRSRPWRRKKCRYTKQQAKRLQAIRTSVRDERFFRECHPSERILR